MSNREPMDLWPLFWIVFFLALVFEKDIHCTIRHNCETVKEQK